MNIGEISKSSKSGTRPCCISFHFLCVMFGHPNAAVIVIAVACGTWLSARGDVRRG